MNEARPNILYILGSGLTRSAQVVGEITILGLKTLYWAFRRPIEMGEIIRQVEYLGTKSVSIALLTSLFTGMVLVLQFSIGLERFGAKEYVSIVVALAIVRELGPVLTSVVVGGRVGSGIAAELGSMKVTEQIDAISALGANPVKKLVVPRMIAMFFGLPMLAFLADIVGILGGMVIADFELGLRPTVFISDVLHGVDLYDVFNGLSKTFVFAIGIVLIGCYHGMAATGGTEGVGRATTKTVVWSLVFIFAADFFLTKLLILLPS